jgi:hypothetical protein
MDPLPYFLKDSRQFFLNLFRRERLPHITRRPQLYRLHHFRLSAYGSNHDDGNSAQVIHLPDSGEKLQAIHLRHIDIGEDQSEGTVAQYIEGFGSVPGFLNLTEGEIRLPKHPLQNLPYSGGIIDDQNVQKRSCSHYVPELPIGWAEGED